MSTLIIVDKTVGPITDFHNLVAAHVKDKVLYVMSSRANRAFFVTHHFVEAGYDVRNLCYADNTIDAQIDRFIPDVEDVDSILVVGALSAPTVVGVASIIDAFIEADRPVLSYEV